MRIQRSPKLVSNINGSPVLVQKVGIKTLKDPGKSLRDLARAEVRNVSTQITRVQENQSTTLELISVDTDAPNPTLSEENASPEDLPAIDRSDDVLVAEDKSVTVSVPATPVAGLLTRQQYDAAVTNLTRINQDLAAAQNQLNTLYRNRNPRNAAQIRALGTTIARLQSQAASAKQTVDRLKKSI